MKKIQIHLTSNLNLINYGLLDNSFCMNKRTKCWKRKIPAPSQKEQSNCTIISNIWLSYLANYILFLETRGFFQESWIMDNAICRPFCSRSSQLFLRNHLSLLMRIRINKQIFFEEDKEKLNYIFLYSIWIFYLSL